MKSKIAFIIFILIICLRGTGYAIDKEASHKARVVIPEVAMLAIQHDANSNLQFAANVSNTAGDQIELNSVDQSSVWLNYSSVVSPNQKRKVTATVLGDIPTGMALKVKTQESTLGVGETGSGNGTILLSNSPADIISGIGSCYTGSGVQKGQQLLYELEVNNQQFYRNEEIHDLSLSVVYTLTDDN